MDNVEEQILSYPHLSVDRQREVEVYVEEHPEWAPLLRDVRGLESFVRGGADEGGETSLDVLLTAYVVVRHVQERGEVSTALERLFEALEERLKNEPELRERVDAIRHRLERAEARLDPVSHVEELTGHSLAPEENQASASSEARSASETNASERAPTVALFDWIGRLPLAVRGVGAAVVLLFGTYAALFVASEASQSTLGRLAAVDVSTQMVESYYSTNTRGALPSADTLTADGLYLEALSTLRDARTSTLGLFPRYDSTALEEAETKLKRVLDQTESGSFLALEVQFYLGKVALAQERVEAARDRFEMVVKREGRLAEDARRILQTLRAEYEV